MPATTSRTSTDSDKGFAKNPDYLEFAPLWMRCRDAAAGQDAIRGKEKMYLPQLSGMSDTDYKQYLFRAMFYNSVGRTATGLTGTVMRKPIDIEYPSGQLEDLEDLGVSCESVAELISRTVHTQLVVGRVGHLVDASEDGTRVYVTEYDAESILNWHEERVDGKMLLTLVVLHEKRWQVGPAPKYEQVAIDQFRVLRLGVDPAVVRRKSPTRDGNGAIVGDTESVELADGFREDDMRQPFYFQEIWIYDTDDRGEQTEDLILERTIVPKKSVGGALWDEIPFQFTGVHTDEPTPDKPPLLDLINVNMNHYLNSADLEWGRHWTCLPTPWVTGASPDDKPKIGSSTAWVMTEADAKVGMLEFTGAGLGHLQAGMEHKEKIMAVLGSRLLDDSKGGVEAAEAIRLRLTGDSAVLSAIAFQAGQSWTKILRWVSQWQSTGDPKGISVTLNTDFNPARLSSDDLAKLMEGLQNGTIDIDTYFWNLEKGEIVKPGTTQAQFEGALAKGMPGAPTPPGDTESEMLGDDG